MGDEGIEHPPLTPSRRPISPDVSANSGAHDAPNYIQDPDLALVVDRWPTLPEHFKAAIRALVQAHTDTRREERQA